MFSKMNFKYVRIHGQELAENTMYAKGVFSMCWQHLIPYASFMVNL